MLNLQFHLKSGIPKNYKVKEIILYPFPYFIRINGKHSIKTYVAVIVEQH